MKNLAKIYHSVDQEGLLWYHKAHAFCKELAEKHNLSLSIVCGIVSALSPSTNWEQNKRDAVNLIKGKRKGFVTYGRNIQKARMILKGEIRPEDAFNLRTGAKTYNFFHNLMCPYCDHHVTIDRHAYRVATGKEYTKLSPYQYEKIANHYRRAAKRLNILPMELQAVLWTAYRKQNNIQQNVPF